MEARKQDVTEISTPVIAGLENTGPKGSWVRGDFWYLKRDTGRDRGRVETGQGPAVGVTDDAVYMVARIALAF